MQYAGVYPGIDLVYYGNQHQLEYDFDVAPGADPTAITLSFYHFIATDEPAATVVDVMAPYVWDTLVDPEPQYIAGFSNLDAATSATWTRRMYQLPVSALAGRTMEFGFVAGTDATLNTATLFLIDTVSLTATACP